MKAIVLTYDRNRAQAEHMFYQYARLWPGHPFRFWIPYQTMGKENLSSREYIKTEEGFKETILTLLEELDDEEWIYWCVDDKYPIDLDLARLKPISNWVGQITSLQISGILFCRCRNMLKEEFLTGRKIIDDNGYTYLERKGYEQIWLHQFLRVKVIRHLFNSFPQNIPYAKVMDGFKRKVKKPESHRLFVSEQNLAVFGESTERGELTQNCFQSIMQNGLNLPAWFSKTNGQTVIMGDL